MSTTRNLKRRARESDDEATSVKQPRVGVQNTHVRRLPPLRRSDSQVLDINASKPVIQRLPPVIESVPIEPSDQYRDGDQDMGGSTEEESQDEDSAWNRRAKAHRHVALFKRPREAQKIRLRPVAQTVSEVALLEGSDSDSDKDDVKLLPTSNTISRLRKLAALRTERAAMGKAASSSKPRVVTKASSCAPGPVVAPPSVASSSTSTATKVTSRSVSRTSSRTTITTTISVSQRVQEIDEITSSCPPCASRARGPKLIPAPEVGPTPKQAATRLQRKSSRIQNAIDAIAGSSSTNTSSVAFTSRRPTPTAPLATQPSAVLRRSRRLFDMRIAPEME